jgi:hypothetical protein
LSRFYAPDIAMTRDGADLRVADQLATRLTHATQVALMDRMDIHVGRAGLVDRADYHLRTQHGHAFASLLRGQQFGLGRHRTQDFPVLVEQGLLPRRGNHQRAARRQQRMRGKALRRICEKGVAGHRQRAHLRRAVAFHEQRGGSAGGVIAWLTFPLQHGDAAVRREPVRDGGASDTCADYQKVRAEWGRGCSHWQRVLGDVARRRKAGRRLMGPASVFKNLRIRKLRIRKLSDKLRMPRAYPYVGGRAQQHVITKHERILA